MVADEDTVNDLIRKYFFKGLKYREICLFLERYHECVVSSITRTSTTLKRKVKQFGLRRRMPCHDIGAIRRTVTHVG